MGGMKPMPDNEPWVIAHGVLLGVAWLGCVPLGIVCALPVGRRLLGTRWLMAHQLFVHAAVALTIIGTIVAIATKQVMGAAGHVTVHTVLGYIVLGLAMLQLFGGMVRPTSAIESSDDEKAKDIEKSKSKEIESSKSAERFVWEILHKYGGRLLVLVALADFGLGINSAYYPMRHGGHGKH